MFVRQTYELKNSHLCTSIITVLRLSDILFSNKLHLFVLFHQCSDTVDWVSRRNCLLKSRSHSPQEVSLQTRSEADLAKSVMTTEKHQYLNTSRVSELPTEELTESNHDNNLVA